MKASRVCSTPRSRTFAKTRTSRGAAVHPKRNRGEFGEIASVYFEPFDLANLGTVAFGDNGVDVGEAGRSPALPVGIANFNACEPVKVVIKTDRGDAVYRFR